jgi:chaperone modulatory protein CbpM
MTDATDTSYYLTLTEVTRSIRMPEQTVITIVDHGIVEPSGRQPADWRFDPPMVITIRKACRLQHDLELDWPGTALALELIGQLQQLRQDNRRLRRQLDRLTG